MYLRRATYSSKETVQYAFHNTDFVMSSSLDMVFFFFYFGVLRPADLYRADQKDIQVMVSVLSRVQ